MTESKRGRHQRHKTWSTAFDAYLFVDWSANSTPKLGKDSIWVGEAWYGGHELNWSGMGAVNPPTRREATSHIRERLRTHVQLKRRTLVCFDFSYAYPHCSASRTIGQDWWATWEQLSQRITDDARNSNNRFDVANELNSAMQPSGAGFFWGKPVGKHYELLPHLPRKKPEELKTTERSAWNYRVVEQRLRQHGKSVFSAWQLYGNGSVGSQTLVGLPRLHELCTDPDLAEYSSVWPFQTGWSWDLGEAPKIVHAEFWPGILPFHSSLHPIRDAAQVLSAVDWAAATDGQGKLKSLFDPLPDTDPDRDLAQSEGWILGFTDRERKLATPKAPS